MESVKIGFHTWQVADVVLGTDIDANALYLEAWALVTRITNVDDEPREFVVVHQGLPSSDYDSSCDGTWLLMKIPYKEKQA